MRKDERTRPGALPVFALATMLALVTVTLAEARHPGPEGRHGPPPIDDPCAADCIDEHRACMDGVRDVVDACASAAGCELSREDLRAICGNGNHDSDDCRAAREAIRDCVGPCHDASRTDVEACREDNRECLETLCGIDVDQKPVRPGRFQRPDRPSLGS